MTNLEELIKAIAENSYGDLLEFLKNFVYWFDPGGWADDNQIKEYLFGSENKNDS